MRSDTTNRPMKHKRVRVPLLTSGQNQGVSIPLSVRCLALIEFAQQVLHVVQYAQVELLVFS
jgi:hypothetical protein